MDRFAEDPPIERRVGSLLEERSETVAVAETCTGGMVTALLTSVPGAGAYLDRAYVPYAYDALRTQLGIPREALDAHGVVSPPITEELARRARDRADATWGVSTTGIAGPMGETAEKPIGTSYIGIAYAGLWESGNSFAETTAHHFKGDRGANREQLSRTALESLFDHLVSDEE